jgi:hypothetical protein
MGSFILKMNIPKKLIGWWFILTGFAGGMFLGYLQMTQNIPSMQLSQSGIIWIFSFIYISFLGVWYALFDYVLRAEENK